MKLEILVPAERLSLAAVRAEAWRGWMTTEQFTERNARLNAHELAAERCTTFVWRAEGGEILSSMELFDITLGLTDGRDSWSEDPAVLIASVITSPEHRSKGYAAAMIAAYFDKNPDQNAVLYSDIGPVFYERFGFREAPCFVTEKKTGALSDATARPIGIKTFSRKVGDLRYNTLLDKQKAGATLLPDPSWLDWRIECFRYFAEVANMPFFDRLYWSLDHGEEHLLAFVPNFPERKLEGLFVETDCQECLDFGAGLAGEWGLTGFRYWSSKQITPEDKAMCPMIRVPTLGPDAMYHDVQFCDWW